MKVPISILIAGILMAVAVYAGLTDARRTYMNGCVSLAQQMGQSAEFAESSCAFKFKS